MDNWKKASEELPSLDTPVWGGWFEDDGSFTSGIFVLAGEEIRPMWWRCEETISYDNFGWPIGDEFYPITHWMYLPKPPNED